MSSSWLPTWAGTGWTVVFAVILLVHLQHVVGMRGQWRIWHGGHVLMALGMVDMFWPVSNLPVGAHAGETVFAAASVATVLLIAVLAARGGVVRAVWPVAVVDLAAMVYMFAMMSARSAALSVLLAAWFAAEAVAWLVGPALMCRGLHRPHARATPTASPAAHLDGAVRVTLAVMSLGMAYMFLAMQFGMHAGPAGMPGM